jgi:type I restriction enzyme M protein
MFVQSEKFIEAHAGKLGDISIYGQESNYTTWRLAKMNLAIRGIDAQIAHGDTFHNHRHPDLKADCDAEACARFVMAAEQAEWVP